MSVSSSATRPRPWEAPTSVAAGWLQTQTEDTKLSDISELRCDPNGSFSNLTLKIPIDFVALRAG